MAAATCAPATTPFWRSNRRPLFLFLAPRNRGEEITPKSEKVS